MNVGMYVCAMKVNKDSFPVCGSLFLVIHVDLTEALT